MFFFYSFLFSFVSSFLALVGYTLYTYIYGMGGGGRGGEGGGEREMSGRQVLCVCVLVYDGLVIGELFVCPPSHAPSLGNYIGLHLAGK